MFPKISNWAAFVLKVNLICHLILQSVQRENPNVHLISVDEKTGIQALERIEGVAPDSAGRRHRRESEYKRHGTTCLMAAINVGEGNIVHQRLKPTRKEDDFAEFITQTVAKFPSEDEVIIMADQLNIHLSESLVIWVAQQIGFQGPLGKKGKQGILKNQESRSAFLEKPEHRIRFVFTPKHCSWINPIENWFAKLQRHIISNGNFCSVKELEEKVEAYITYYNRCLITPLKWKFKGFIKAQQLKNLNGL
ncbi:MAG: IS630 family transposase [Sphingobacteriales bacterium]|nr:MAG: IS630 family transposase [Sphingobacteriales bacterium]